MKPMAGLIEAFRAEQRAKLAAGPPVEWATLPGVRRQFPSGPEAKPKAGKAKPVGGAAWRFGMVGNLVGEVWRRIDDLPSKDRPVLVDRAFKAILLHLEPNTGRVLLDREQLAEAMRCHPSKVGAAVGVLVRMGALRREAKPVLGMRGPGEVRYFINPDVAWNGSTRARLEAAALRGGPLSGMAPVVVPLARVLSGASAL